MLVSDKEIAKGDSKGSTAARSGALDVYTIYIYIYIMCIYIYI